MMYPKITFRPTQEMHEVVEEIKKDTGMTNSEIMRNIISDYIVFVRKSLNNNI